MSGVGCQVSGVTCHVSCVMRHLLLYIFFFGQSDRASPWRVCYQRGLPRLVSFLSPLNICTIFLKSTEYLDISLISRMLPCQKPEGLVTNKFTLDPFPPSWPLTSYFHLILNRPGVAGSVLQIPLSFINLVILFLQIFKTSLFPNR